MNKQQLEKLVKEFQEKANLQHYRIDLIIEPKSNASGDIALSKTFNNYFECEIHVFPEFYADLNKKKTEKEKMDFARQVIAHEVSHIISNPLNRLVGVGYLSQEEHTSAREQVTSMIERILTKIK